MNLSRTDLAVETAEALPTGQDMFAPGTGVTKSECLLCGCPVTRIHVHTPAGARAIGKPEGRYITIDLRPALSRQEALTGRAALCLCRELRALLPPPSDGPALVVGLGNDAMTPDAVGAAALEHLLVTRHMVRSMPRQFGALTPVACVYEEKKAETVDVQALHDQLAGEKVEAVCNKETGKPTQSHIGVAFDVAAVQAQLDAAPAGTEFLADAQVEFPTVSTEELEECMFRDVLGTCTTKCAGPWGRHQNIKLAAAAINGRIYNPGEEFWYNSTVGQRTAARGYHEAGVYEAGRTTTGIGGGICQVSSTLYYAVMLSDLDIVLRYCHMFNPGYLPIGCDATVSWGGPDFAFRNSRDYPIKVVTSYNDNTNELTCTILGTKVDDHYVVITNAVLASYDYQVVYQESPDVAPGDEVIDQYGHTGYFVRTWRNIYDGNDNLLSSRVEADSHYDVGNKIILVAPGYLPDTGE